MHAQDAVAKGVLGKMIDALSAPTNDPAWGVEDGTPPPPPYSTGAYSLAGIRKMLDGRQAASMLDSTDGAIRFNEYHKLSERVSNLTSGQLGSVFGETFATMIDGSLRSSERLGNILETITLQSTRWDDTNGDGNVNNADSTAPHSCAAICRSFKQVARVIHARGQLGEERQVFYLERGAFDTHSSAQEQVQSNLAQINVALTAFVDELKLLGVWDDVAIVTSSDFARTLDSNGAGTDHAWGGNYMLLGGGIKGGTIHGEYPTSLLASSDVHVGRGRLLPTRSWEAVWSGLAQWFDVPEARIPRVLPNRANFPAHQLFTRQDLFEA